jgi:hypothetical protein
MQRFFFDCRDGDNLHIDKEGLELSSIELVQGEARRALIDMARDMVCVENEEPRHFAIEVRDTDRPVLVASLSFYICKFSPNRPRRDTAGRQD